MATITLDALGTLVELESPAPLLVTELRARGLEISAQQGAAAIAAEVGYYRAHHQLGADAGSLALLRARCAEVLRDALLRSGVDARAIAADELRDALLAALRFRAYPEVPAALRALRVAGHRLVVVSNWDFSLHQMLRTTGLRALVDAALSSAEAGVAKPDAAIFARAIEMTGGSARGALHVGDSLEHDVAGALAAGLRPVLVVRDGITPALPRGVAVVTSLAELSGLAA